MHALSTIRTVFFKMNGSICDMCTNRPSAVVARKDERGPGMGWVGLGWASLRRVSSGWLGPEILLHLSGKFTVFFSLPSLCRW